MSALHLDLDAALTSRCQMIDGRRYVDIYCYNCRSDKVKISGIITGNTEQ